MPVVQLFWLYLLVWRNVRRMDRAAVPQQEPGLCLLPRAAAASTARPPGGASRLTAPCSQVWAANVSAKSLIGTFIIRAPGYFPLCWRRFVLNSTLIFVHEASMPQLGVVCVSFLESCDQTRFLRMTSWVWSRPRPWTKPPQARDPKPN